MDEQSAAELSRDPSPIVKRQLRREVGFGCPINDCRNPLLTYHHFDPPWKVEKHHNPEGMIAVCTKHHPMADLGQWSKQELRNFKSRDFSVENVVAKFEWSRPNPIVRLGGVFVDSRMIGALTALGIPSGLLELDEDPVGLLSLSFRLEDEAGRLLARMERNSFEAVPRRIYDLDVNPGATKLKIRVRKTDSILELWSSRITHDELVSVIEQDYHRWRRFLKESEKRDPGFTTYLNRMRFTKENPFIEASYGPQLPVRPSEIAEESYEAYKAFVLEQAQDVAGGGYLDDEGKFSILDFRQMTTYRGYRKVTVQSCFGMRFGFVNLGN